MVTITIERDMDRASFVMMQQYMQRPYSLPLQVPDTADEPDSEKSDRITVPVSYGSGFIVSEDGAIVTNDHVLESGDRIKVTLSDRSEYPAHIIGRDPKTDLAVIKIDAPDKLPALAWGDSGSLGVGHWVIAIGAPYNLDCTVTVGIVSHLGRSVGMNLYEQFIQTDAVINPGNSGGPLLNLKGEVVGVCDLICGGQCDAPQNTGLSLAIPSEMAKPLVAQMKQNGEVIRPWLGLTVKETKDTGSEARVVVEHVVPDTPAEEAGIEPGDVVLKIGDAEALSVHLARFAVLKYKPGDEIPLLMRRQGEELLVRVVAAKQAEDWILYNSL